MKSMKKILTNGLIFLSLSFGLTISAVAIEPLDQETIEVIRLAQIAAENGDVNAQVNLGVLYYGGDYVRQDFAKALRYSQKAAEQGNAIAQTNMAMMYSGGKGVTQNHAQAFKWMKKAAEIQNL